MPSIDLQVSMVQDVVHSMLHNSRYGKPTILQQSTLHDAHCKHSVVRAMCQTDEQVYYIGCYRVLLLQVKRGVVFSGTQPGAMYMISVKP